MSDEWKITITILIFLSVIGIYILLASTLVYAGTNKCNQTITDKKESKTFNTNDHILMPEDKKKYKKKEKK